MQSNSRERRVREYFTAANACDRGAAALLVATDVEVVVARRRVGGTDLLRPFAPPAGTRSTASIEPESVEDDGTEAVRATVRHVETRRRSGEPVVQRRLAAVFRFAGERITRVEIDLDG